MNIIFWRKKYWIKNKDVAIEESSYEEKQEDFDKGGLGTQLRPKSKGAHKGSYGLEKILGKLKRELLSVGWDNEMPKICKKN